MSAVSPAPARPRRGRRVWVAVLVLGAVVVVSWFAIWAWRQREEITCRTMIQQMGGTVTVRPSGPTWLAGVIDKRYCETVIGVILRKVPAPLAKLKCFRNLESLVLFALPIKDEDLVHLEGLRRLKSLNLLMTQVTGPGLVYLKELPDLQELRLGPSVSDETMWHISGLEHLKTLYILSSAGLTDDGLSQLARLPGLGTVCLINTGVSEAGVAKLQKALPQLNIVRQNEK